MTATADVLDEHGDRASVCAIAFRQFGGRRAFEGPISTVRCDEDNVLVRRRLSDPGERRRPRRRRRWLPSGGPRRRDRRGLARDNGWAGLVINGCVRDVAALRELDLGIKAIGSTPRASGKEGLGEIDVPVTFGGVTFHPGDMLFSDDDGVVVLDRAE